MPQPVDPGLLIAGFRGAMYHYDGSRWASCTSWELSMSWTNTDEQPLGTIVPMAVTQSVTFSLAVSELTIDDNIPAAMLRGIQDPSQPYVPNFRFIGEVWRPDGTVGRYLMDSCVPDGTNRLAAATPGTTMTRDLTFRVNSPPDLSGLMQPIDPGLGAPA